MIIKEIKESEEFILSRDTVSKVAIGDVIIEKPSKRYPDSKDFYEVTNVIKSRNSKNPNTCFTIKGYDGRTIYSYPSSKLYGMTVIKSPDESYKQELMDKYGKKNNNKIKELYSSTGEKQTSDKLINIIKNEFGTTEKLYNGPTYILPDGSFLDMSKCTHHSDVEKWLIDNGYSNNEYIKTAGSKTMYDLGCIRCDTVKYYIALSTNKQPTGEQYNSLLLWLDYLQRFHRAVEVITPDNQHQTYLFDNETISDLVVDKIRAYYYSGVLREARDQDSKHAKNFIYKRERVGTVIVPSITENNTESILDEYDFYNQLLKEADEIAEKVKHGFEHEEKSPSGVLLELGFQSAGEHDYDKTVEKDGKIYKTVFDFWQYDENFNGIVIYYVTINNKIPQGYTASKIKINWES